MSARMNKPLQRFSKHSSPGLAEFEKRLRMARASELALLHHYTRAETVLCEIGLSNATAEELDLLARIHVRQSRFDDAKQRWELAMERDARKRDQFENCLQVLEEHRLKWERQVRLNWVLVFVMLCISILLCTSMLARLVAYQP
jgi:hypothetical protein